MQLNRREELSHDMNKWGDIDLRMLYSKSEVKRTSSESFGPKQWGDIPRRYSEEIFLWEWEESRRGNDSEIKKTLFFILAMKLIILINFMTFNPPCIPRCDLIHCTVSFF